MAAAAAAFLESVCVPHASSAFQKPALSASPRMALASSISSVSGVHGMGLFPPEFKGLKLARRAATRSAAVVGGGRRVVRRRVVVCEAQETDFDVPDVTTAQWQAQVLESDIPVLVEFWAPWCGPCRIVLPVISELSKAYAGKLKCLKIDTDKSPDIATKYGIRSIPTIMIFKNGEKKDAVIGAVQKTTLTACIEKFL